MVSRLAIARDTVKSASERTDDATVREQLHSIDRALVALPAKRRSTTMSKRVTVSKSWNTSP
jgi:hypothetical protein